MEPFSDLLALSAVQTELRLAVEARTVPPELLVKRGRPRTSPTSAISANASRRRSSAAVDGVARVGADRAGDARTSAHPPTVEKSPVNLGLAVSDALIVSMNAYKYVADVETDLRAAAPDVMCNGGEIQQVLLNLFLNAAG